MFLNRYPYSDFHELNADWLIHTTNEVRQIANLINSKIAEIVQGWIDDGTIEQLINEELFSRYNVFYIPEDFGGVGDGLTDCTEAFDQACKAMANGTKKILYIPQERTYVITQSIAIPAGCMLVGGGRTSRIYFKDDELPSGSFGVGITTGGDNVIITNLCIDHYRTGVYDPGGGGLTSAVAVGTLICAGRVTLPVDNIPRATVRRNIIIDRLWMSHGRYCLQCDNDSEERSIEDVYVSNVFAPSGMVSMAPRGGKLRNICYQHIHCDVLRVGAYSGYYGYNLTVDDVYCTYLHCRAYGAHISNITIDRSGTPGNESNHMADLMAGNTIDNLKVIPADDTAYLIYLRGTEREFRFNNCDLVLLKTEPNETSKVFNVASGTNTAPVYMMSCNAQQTGDDVNNINGAAVLGSIDIPVPTSFSIIG